MLRCLLKILIISIITLTGIPVLAEEFAESIVSIVVTRQDYDYMAPWQKSAVEKEDISGVVIEGNRILTLSYRLTDHVLIEVSKFGASRKYTGKVILKDYYSGLALITVTNEDFFKGLKPVIFNTNGAITSGNAVSVKWDKNEVLKQYPMEYAKSVIEFYDSSGVILVHHMISDIESGGKGEPVFVNRKLAGISSWSIPKNKIIKLIDLQVIERLLRDLKEGGKGMPYFNIAASPLGNDESLREYYGLNDSDSGVLVTNVPPDTSGSDVLKKDDIITNINGIGIDDNGLYDSGTYGKLNFYGVFYLKNIVGDKVSMKIIRNKERIDISFTLKPYNNDSFIIPVVNYDKPPEFYILGGLVFQELTREYLKTWGKEWPDKADKRLMYYYDNYSKNHNKVEAKKQIIKQVEKYLFWIFIIIFVIIILIIIDKLFSYDQIIIRLGR